MKDLSDKIRSLWPSIIDGFEKHIQKNWEKLYLVDFFEWKKDKKTEEVTKVVSPILNEYLKLKLKSIGFELSESNGKDYVWDGIELEGKLSLSDNSSWTGNGFRKTNWHLLIKIKFDDLGLISGSFVCLLPLNNCKSQWTKSGANDNFSTLKLRSEDIEKIVVVFGTFKKNPVFLKPILL